MHRRHRFWIDGDDSYNEPWNESRLWFPTQHKVYSMNLHLPDFEGSNDTIDAYNDDAQPLCNSDARLQPRPDFRGTVPIFVPALVYPGDLNRGNSTEHDRAHVLNVDGRGWSSSAEPGRSGINGEDVKDYSLNFRRCWHADRKRDVAHGLSINEDPEEQSDRTEQTAEASESVSRPVRKAKIPFGEQLTVSHEDNPQFFASTVCQTPQFVGPHYVNLIEGLFCDMEGRTTRPPCDKTRKYNCFDMDNKNLLGFPGPINDIDTQLADTSSGSQSDSMLPVVKKQIKRIHEQQ